MLNPAISVLLLAFLMLMQVPQLPLVLVTIYIVGYIYTLMVFLMWRFLQRVVYFLHFNFVSVGLYG